MDAFRFNRLIARVSRDKQAFEELYEFYYGRAVRHLCKSFTKEIAEDSVQEFFYRLIDMPPIRKYVFYPTSWLFKCCEHIAIGLVAKEKNIFGFEQEVLGDRGIVELADCAFDELIFLFSDEMDKTILKMRYLDGYSFKVISSMLGIKYDTVRQKASRAVRELRRQIVELERAGKENDIDYISVSRRKYVKRVRK